MFSPFFETILIVFRYSSNYTTYRWLWRGQSWNVERVSTAVLLNIKLYASYKSKTSVLTDEKLLFWKGDGVFPAVIWFVSPPFIIMSSSVEEYGNIIFNYIFTIFLTVFDLLLRFLLALLKTFIPICLVTNIKCDF